MTYTEQMKAILEKAGGNTDSNLYSEILLAILDALSSSGGGTDIPQSDIDNLKKLLAIKYEDEYTLIDDAGASPAFEQISGQISSLAYANQDMQQSISDMQNTLERVPQQSPDTAMVGRGADGVYVSYIPIWDEHNVYTLRSGIFQMTGVGKTVSKNDIFEIGGQVGGNYSVVVESLDTTSKQLNTMVCSDGKFNFQNDIALGNAGVIVYILED